MEEKEEGYIKERKKERKKEKERCLRDSKKKARGKERINKEENE